MVGELIRLSRNIRAQRVREPDENYLPVSAIRCSLERVMNFKRDTDGAPTPEASWKLAGGANHRSWMQDATSPGGAPEGHIDLMSDVPSGQTKSTALEVHDTL